MKICNHYIKPFYNQNPTDKEINKFRMYKCSQCHKWYAFMNEEKPYIVKEVISKSKEYNPNYGDDRICQCGHKYYRHFDTYENMYPCGCKYCSCFEFIEKEL